METTIILGLYWDIILAKGILGLYGDNGKENGNPRSL